RDSILTFSWPAVEGAELYHHQVSRRRDMRLPYRPSFDRMHKTNRFGVPFTGIFSPGEVYYWRVRCRDRHGIWGDWGPTWSFSWEGPRVPVNLRRAISDRQITLHWGPNPRGPRPVRYEVYGSDEKGFSISKEPYVVQGLGKVGANFLGTTRATTIRVVDGEADKPNMNKTFFRVVAIDSHGTQSGCSDYVEMPHPFIYSQPAAPAVAGKPYRHQIRTLTSLGDYQHRYEKPNKQFWQRERCRFELPEAPAWLKIDEASGMLSGQPGREDVGQHKVTVRVANQSGDHATRSSLLMVE
ncbi:MAG: Ig domain-containing protein, partial [Planctomycetota bacterium]